MGIANVENSVAAFTFAVCAEIPTPSPASVPEKTAVASATSEGRISSESGDSYHRCLHWTDPP